MGEERYNDDVDMPNLLRDLLCPIQKGYTADSSDRDGDSQEIVWCSQLLQIQEQVGLNEPPTVSKDKQEEDEGDDVRKSKET